MELENKIKLLLKELDQEQKKELSVLCIERVIELYKNVDLHVDISIVNPSLSNGSAYNALYSIFNFLKKVNILNQSEQIKEQIKECDPLILDIEGVFENSTQNYVASLVAQSIDYLLNYCLKEDEKYVLYCLSNNIEILNQLKSEEYCTNINATATNDELDKYLRPIFEQELNVQVEMINYIKENKIESLKILVFKTKINWE